MTLKAPDIRSSSKSGASRPPPDSAGKPSEQTLRACVTTVLGEYFAQVDHDMITDLYQMVLSEVEAPLLEAVLYHAGSNQSKAAQMLGLNRGTLRKKLRQYNLME